MSQSKKQLVPFWVIVLQVILTLIMLGQVYMYFFNNHLITESGIEINGVPTLNLIYEMGARTFVMVIASIYVLVTQNPKQFLVVLIMNIAREAQEMVIDPLFPILNAPVSPLTDFLIHLVIVIIEIWAFVVVYKSQNK
ncbi:hypothetical protein SAMN04489761_4162 [Tenacibaculum sp. MAR_2009_124]|uniref:hypothetical protein n=1 Tax=Tenacibaculum sp. MAR_2009_124 TaxID=1250059 RepID=UPI000895A8B7|nr:hypothetical protein [Tenacibaculum sp. MAR_2009_124]SED06677.1 hypothetical protein SAMN04489761_4162 [Tenacibaculum sp. MAR_2009_124]